MYSYILSYRIRIGTVGSAIRVAIHRDAVSRTRIGNGNGNGNTQETRRGARQSTTPDMMQCDEVTLLACNSATQHTYPRHITHYIRIHHT